MPSLEPSCWVCRIDVRTNTCPEAAGSILHLSHPHQFSTQPFRCMATMTSLPFKAMPPQRRQSTQVQNEIRSHIGNALDRGVYHIIFLSGAPGAGKTLVGLDIVMRGSYADRAVFVTGNAPLVEVLNEALSGSYRAKGRSAASWTPTGYRRADAKLVTSAADFKIVKAPQLSR